jgi:2-phospho-L-lactate transferase/gluconeogenesis factor (CofD/UPF0052 family)
MNVEIHCDRYGHIVSVVSASAEAGAPSAGVFPMSDSQRVDLELDTEQGGEPLINLHTQYRLDLTREEPRLVRIAQKRRTDAT